MSASPSVTLDEELEKNPELKLSDVESLREWCKSQPHLPKIRDAELALFLHSNYYDAEAAKSTIEAYFTLRSESPEIFLNRDPVGSKELRLVFDTASVLPLEKRTREGYSVILGKLLDTDPAKYVSNDHAKYMNMCIDLMLHTEGTGNGFVIVYDTVGASFGHALRISLSTTKKLSQYLQEGLPLRLKGVHVMNANSLITIMMNMVKPFMKKELFDMIHTHTTMESFDKAVPLEILPNELGGKAGPLLDLHNAQVKKLESFRDWFLEEETRVRIDEGKRVDKEKTTASSFFGFKRGV